MTVPVGSGVSHLHLLTLTAKMNILEITKSSSAKTEFSVFSVFFSSVFGFFVFFNTDVGVGFGFFKNIAISVSVFGYRLGSSLGQLRGTQGHRQCHHSIERIRRPVRL